MQTYDDAAAAINKHDYVAALRVLRPLADRGSPKAQELLGVMYLRGWGVPQNDVEAISWFRRAANQRAAGGEIWMGLMYRDGTGVQQDYVTAYMWLTLAAESNEPADVPGHYTPAQSAAMSRDDMARYYMTPVQIEAAQKLAKEWKPSPQAAALPSSR